MGLILLSACESKDNSEAKIIFKNYETDIVKKVPFHKLVEKYFFEPNRLLSDTSLSSLYYSNKSDYLFYKYYLESNWEISYYWDEEILNYDGPKFDDYGTECDCNLFIDTYDSIFGYGDNFSICFLKDKIYAIDGSVPGADNIWINKKSKNSIDTTDVDIKLNF